MDAQRQLKKRENGDEGGKKEEGVSGQEGMTEVAYHGEVICPLEREGRKSKTKAKRLSREGKRRQTTWGGKGKKLKPTHP